MVRLLSLVLGGMNGRRWSHRLVVVVVVQLVRVLHGGRQCLRQAGWKRKF